jgi:single-strand DNA-binding protein
MNKVVIIGRTTKDIELKQTSTGTSVVEFSVAVRRNFKNANGENESDFFNCVAYSKLAETIGRYVKKGDMIGLEGRLQTRNYTNREGNKVYVTEIIAENVEFLQTKKQEGQNPSFVDDDPFKGANLVEVSDDEGLPF